MSADLVDARWVAAYPARLGLPNHPQDGADLIPGETVITGLGRHECEQSANWDVLTAAAEPKPLAKYTKAELVAYAAEHGIELPPDATTKTPILAAIEAAEQPSEPQDDQPDEGEPTGEGGES